MWLGAIYPYSLGARLHILLIQFYIMKSILMTLLISFSLNTHSYEISSCNSNLQSMNFSVFLTSTPSVIVSGTRHGLIAYMMMRYVSLPFELFSRNENSDFLDPYNGRRPTTGRLIFNSIREEVFFRFLLQPSFQFILRDLIFRVTDSSKLSSQIALHSSIIATSVIFGVAHLYNPNPQIRQCFYSMVFGVYVGYLSCNHDPREVIVCHVVANLVDGVINYLFSFF